MYSPLQDDRRYVKLFQDDKISTVNVKESEFDGNNLFKEKSNPILKLLMFAFILLFFDLAIELTVGGAGKVV